MLAHISQVYYCNSALITHTGNNLTSAAEDLKKTLSWLLGEVIRSFVCT